MTTVLCYGDSNTYGYDPKTGLRYKEDVRWPGVLADLLGEGYHVIEEGCNGRTTVTDDPVEGWKNGLDYLRPCLNSHKPVDVVVLMLGTNDLKEIFHLTAEKIADNAGILVDVIQSFTKEKQGFVPKIVLISPPEIGKDMPNSVFSASFAPRSIEESKKFPKAYRRIADSKGCLFLDAAKYIYPSDADSLHLTEEGHKILAEKVAEIVRSIPS